MFKAYSEGLERQRTLYNTIIRCDNVNKLQRTLDTVFSLKFLKRSLQVFYIIFIDLVRYILKWASTTIYIGHFPFLPKLGKPVKIRITLDSDEKTVEERESVIEKEAKTPVICMILLTCVCNLK